MSESFEKGNFLHFSHEKRARLTSFPFLVKISISLSLKLHIAKPLTLWLISLWMPEQVEHTNIPKSITAYVVPYQFKPNADLPFHGNQSTSCSQGGS